jgi:hypothetical protein
MENVTIAQSIITAVASAVVGGIVLIFTNWVTTRLSARIEARKAAQLFYENFYIIEGINPLISYFTRLEIHLLNYTISKPYIPLAEIDPVPVDAVARTQILLKDNIIVELIKKINFYMSEDASEQTSAKIAKALKKTLQILNQLRVDVLAASDMLVRQKGVAPDAFYAYKSIKEIIDALEQQMKPAPPSN